MISLLSDVAQSVKVAEQEKPLNASKIEKAANDLMEKVLFFTQKENENFFKIYKQECIDLTQKISLLNKDLAPQDPEEDDAKERIENATSIVRELMGFENLKPIASAATKLPVPRKASKRSCGNNTCPIIPVAVTLGGIAIALLMNKSLL